MTLKTWILILTILTLAVACDSEPDPRSAAPEETPAPSIAETPSPALSPTLSPACPQQLADASRPSEGVFEGWIDDDGQENDDIAYIYEDNTAEGSCRLTLVIETDSGALHSAPLAEGDDVSGVGPVAIRYLARIDDRPGAEIVVRMLTGASTEFFAVFSLGGGALERVEIAGADPYGDLFPSGGSVGHLEASDCASNAGDDGSIVVSLATPQGDGYKLVRTFYTSADGRFSIDEVVRDRLHDQQDLEIYHEFFGTPFGSCAAGT